MGGGKRYSEKKKKITGSNGEGDGDQKKKKKYRSPHEMPPRISNDNSKYIKKTSQRCRFMCEYIIRPLYRRVPFLSRLL